MDAARLEGEHRPDACLFPLRPGIRGALAGHCNPLQRGGGGREDTSEQEEKKLKPDPISANKDQGYVRSTEAIIPLPKNKGDKMTVKDMVTKSSDGQMRGLVL